MRRGFSLTRIARWGVLLAFLSTASMFGQTWQPMGPPGGDVRSLAADPQQPSRIYLGSTDGHVFGSNDSGEHWQLLGRIGDRLDGIVPALLVDPRDSQRLYAGVWAQDSSAGGGVFESDDAGHTWKLAGLEGQAVRALAQSHSDPDRLVAGTLEGVFGTSDSGRSWQRLSPESDLELRNLDSLAIDPDHPDTLYAGTFHLPWKSTDGGRTWSPIHQGMIDDSDVMSILVDVKHPTRVYASACSGIYRSDNAAGNWEKIQGIPYTARRTYAIAQDVHHPEIIYAGTSEGLWRSLNAGATWKRLTPVDWSINALSVSTDHQERIILGTESLGVMISEDEGEHFHDANNGFNHRQIAAVALDPQRADRVLTVLSHAREPILATDDGGLTWKPLGPGLATRQIEKLYASPDGWWAALTSGGLMKYDGRRKIWSKVGWVTGSAAAVALSRSAAASRSSGANGSPNDGAGVPRRVTASVGERPLNWVVSDMSFADERWFAATDHGLLVSEDRGEHWRLLPLGPLPDLPVASVGASRDGQSLWVVSLRGLVFSSDGGKTWTWHDLPIKSGGAVRLESIPSIHTFVAIAHNGLFISRDSGATWEEPVSGLPELPIEDVAASGKTWVVSIRLGGLYMSSDAGASWNHVPGTLADGFFPAVAAQEHERTLLAASASDGLYEVSLGAEKVDQAAK